MVLFLMWFGSCATCESDHYDYEENGTTSRMTIDYEKDDYNDSEANDIGKFLGMLISAFILGYLGRYFTETCSCCVRANDGGDDSRSLIIPRSWDPDATGAKRKKIHNSTSCWGLRSCDYVRIPKCGGCYPKGRVD